MTDNFQRRHDFSSYRQFSNDRVLCLRLTFIIFDIVKRRALSDLLRQGIAFENRRV